MVGRIKRSILNFFFKIHERNDALLKAKQKQKQNKLYNHIAVIGENTRVFPEASIHNNLSEKTKIVIGNNCDLRGDLLTFGHGGQITIGDFCFIGERTKIWSAIDITIGNRVLISHSVNIHDNNSHPIDATLRHKDFMHIKNIGLQKKNNLNEKKIIIGDDVWIGFNSTIMKGVTIGKGAIIGSNTIIKEDIPDFAVCIGNPMKIIKYTT